MSQFSTGELAKAAEVSVRTVQYYDQRGILTPSLAKKPRTFW